MKVLVNISQINAVLEKNHFISFFTFDILPYIRITEYERGDYIIQNSGSLTRLLYLAEGTAKLYEFHKNGKQSLINFFTAPSFFGGPELFDEKKRPHPLVAQTRCVFIEVDTKRCRSKLLEDAKFLRSFCSMALRQNVVQNRKYMNLTAYPGRNNFAVCLLLLENQGLFSEKYTEIAEYLSISYRHLMHLITCFCKEGILERVSDGLVILDRATLHALADEISNDG